MARKLDDTASATGATLLLVPFIITVLLTAVFVPIQGEEMVGGLGLFTPESYSEMSYWDRVSYLSEVHGGAPRDEWEWDLASLPALGTWYVYYPDGTKIRQDQWHSYVEGTFNNSAVNYYQVAMSMITLNPPALSHIGVAGYLVRIIMIASVCIGLVDLVWIG